MEETQDCLNTLFTLTNVFAAFPVTFQNKSGNKQICFKWKSFRAAYAVTVILIMCCETTGFVYLCIKQGINSLQIGITILKVNGVLTMILVFILAIQWPEVMRKWGELDEAMSCYGVIPQNIILKLKFITLFLVLMAITDQLLLTAFVTSESNTFEISELIRTYVENLCRSVSKFIQYNVFTGIILIVADINHLFAWYIADILIISVSLLLTARFHQISKRIKLLIQHEIIYGFTWMEVRIDLNRLIAFCQIVDDVLGGIVILSISGNMFYLIFQLQSSVLMFRSVFNYFGIFFYASTISYHVLRLLAVIYFAGNVYSIGRTITEQILLVPYEFCNQEVDRLALQIQTNQPALTGINCFIIKYSLLLYVFTAAMSYQLIVVQYELFERNNNGLP